MMLLGFANHFVPEHDPDLPIGALSGDGFQTRLLGSLGPRSVDEPFHASHQEQQPDDAERPQDQDRKQQRLIGSHRP